MQEFPAYTREALLRADWRGLMAIVEFRRAKLAIELFNSGRDGAEQLGKRPDLTDLMLEMGKAQGGPQTQIEDVYGTLKAQQQTTDDEDEEDD